MKRTSYQFTDLPVIDAGEGDAYPRARRPLLWVLAALLLASAGVSVWLMSRQDEPLSAEPSVAYPPSAREKEQLLSSLAGSVSTATEDERLAALENLSAETPVPIEEMQSTLSRLFEGEGR